MSVGKLPEGWVLSSIGEVCELNPKNKLEDSLDVGFMPMAGVPTTFLGKCEYETRKWGEVKKGFTQFQNNDVIFAKITPCFENGKAAVIKNFPNGFGAGSTEYYVLRSIKDFVNPYWLLALVKTKDFLINGALNMSGSVGHKRVPKDFVANYALPLPPLAEQKIIAEKLDTLLAQVDSTKARLEQIPQILKRFRQAVLAAAVSEKNHQSESSIKKLSDISKFQNGYAFKSGWFAKEGSYQVIKLANIRDGYLFLENAPSYVNDEIGREFSKFAPEKGDILISMTGTRFKRDYGFSCLIIKKQKLLINQRVGKITPLQDKISYEYLSLFVRSALFREQFFKGETGGVNQGNVGSQHIASITLSLPSMQEQHEIVRRVEQLFAYADTIEKQVNTALSSVNHLTQSILAKAFRGELTAQWRAENPDFISGENSAAALLEKIKAERAASSGKKSSRKKA